MRKDKEIKLSTSATQKEADMHEDKAIKLSTSAGQKEADMRKDKEIKLSTSATQKEADMRKDKEIKLSTSATQKTADMHEDKVDGVSNRNQTAEQKSGPVGSDSFARKNVYGSDDLDFLRGLARRIASPGIAPDLDQEELAYRLSIIRAAEPRNPFEAMAALHTISISDALMRSERNFVRAESVQQQDSAGRMIYNLARTYLDHLHALERGRSGSDQKVTVGHLSVKDGGQAIVGHLTQTPPANAANKPAADSPPTSPEPKTDPMATVEGDKRRVALARYRPKSNDQ